MERRLTTILAADIAGYSRLMAADEEGVVRRLQAARTEVLGPVVAAHGGRIVKTTGDGWLAEFASPVSAVRAALTIQAGMAKREATQPEDSRLRFRIGVNLGDVVVDGDDMLGDCVNIAARLEGLAPPGGICISRAVQDHAEGRVEAVMTPLGPQTVKNIPAPVEAWLVGTGPAKSADRTAERAAGARPSIAVLPFTNMSGDPEQEFFSDGITEDIITELSRFRLLHVIARNSSFAYKGRSVDVREVGRALGARFVLEGSVRRAGNRIRITAQLIEAEAGNHVWAERYDRDADDIFEVQDDVTRSIAAAMPGRVQSAVTDRAARMRPETMQAYEAVLQARSIRDSFSAEATAEARRLFLKAIDLDPHYARSYSHLADTHYVDFVLGLSDEVTDGRMLALMMKAVRLDEHDSHIQEELGFAYLVDGAWDDAGTQFERAAARAHNNASVQLWCGYGLMMLGRHEEALDMVRRATALDRLHPPYFEWVLGQVLYVSGRNEEAAEVLHAGTVLNSFGHACRTGALARLGRTDAAGRALAAFVAERRREFSGRGIQIGEETVDALAGGYRGMWRRDQDWQCIAEGLRLAGLKD